MSSMTLFWSILNLSLLVLFFYVLYRIIKAAVKNGIKEYETEHQKKIDADTNIQ